ncbi:MAG: dihydroorotate dehydrogenase electron transfer subunit [Actinomycetota bacterium]|nr:dihydroorotate dehydrogenase electron transfer subunit [Actinomycetota bacterium]
MNLGPEVLATGERRTLAPFGRRLASVAGGDDLGTYRLLWAADPGGPRDPSPGQFYMLAAASGWGGGEDDRPYLPRAFSHARVAPDPDGAHRLGFLLEAVGPGTDRLAALNTGEELWLAGPFGTGFRPGRASGGGEAVLVGGGIGAAPILALADELGPDTSVLLGFRTARHATAASLFGGDPRVATDDGSAGRQALVTELLHEELDRDARATVFACGPPPMLEAVRALCGARGVEAQLALESGMACGYGACFGCVVPTRDGFLRLCLDGPVLDAARLETALFEGAGH